MLNTEERYILMNKNKPLAKLSVGIDSAVISEVLDTLPKSIGNVSQWINSRTSIYGRANLLKMAKLAGISTEYEFLTISKALSINDTLWVNDLRNPTTWGEINPYTNPISRIIAEIAIDGIQHFNNQNLKSPSPQYTIDGSVDKCVKRIKNQLYLYKTDGEKWSDLAGCRPYSEYYVSNIEKQLGIHSFIDYNIVVNKTISGKFKPYAYCKLFTNEKYGLVQMGNSIYSDTPVNELDSIIDIRSKIIMREMLLIDSLTLNFDRHMGNYGFIIDNDNYKILSLAPIYDNDCALGALQSIQFRELDEAFDEIIYKNQPKFEIPKGIIPDIQNGYDRIIYWAMTKEIYHNLKNTGTIKIGKQLPGISDERYKFMEYIVNRRRKEILQMFN